MKDQTENQATEYYNLLIRDEDFMKETLLEVFKIACKETKHMKQWILEIMGQVLFLLRQNCSVWTFNFMFEMFVLSLSALAGNFDDPGVNYKVKYI